jgi:hypothetical protein
MGRCGPEDQMRYRAEPQGECACEAKTRTPSFILPSAELVFCIRRRLAYRSLIHRGCQNTGSEVTAAGMLLRLLPIPAGGEYDCRCN